MKSARSLVPLILAAFPLVAIAYNDESVTHDTVHQPHRRRIRGIAEIVADDALTSSSTTTSDQGPFLMSIRDRETTAQIQSMIIRKVSKSGGAMTKEPKSTKSPKSGGAMTKEPKETKSPKTSKEPKETKAPKSSGAMTKEPKSSYKGTMSPKSGGMGGDKRQRRRRRRARDFDLLETLPTQPRDEASLSKELAALKLILQDM